MTQDQQGYDPGEDLTAILDHYQPRSIVHAGTLAGKRIRDWQRNRDGLTLTALPADDPASALPLTQLHELALISDTLEHLSHEQGKLILGQLRNMGATRIAVLMTDEGPWQFADFIGMGFTRLYHYSSPVNAVLYAYDIATYNHRREWNNPDYWANPEMWDKARW